MKATLQRARSSRLLVGSARLTSLSLLSFAVVVGIGACQDTTPTGPAPSGDGETAVHGEASVVPIRGEASVVPIPPGSSMDPGYPRWGYRPAVHGVCV